MWYIKISWSSVLHYKSLWYKPCGDFVSDYECNFSGILVFHPPSDQLSTSEEFCEAAHFTPAGWLLPGWPEGDGVCRVWGCAHQPPGNRMSSSVLLLLYTGTKKPKSPTPFEKRKTLQIMYNFDVNKNLCYLLSFVFLDSRLKITI